MPIDTDRLYAVSEALPLLGMQTTRFYEELKAGRIGAVKNGTRTFLTGSEIIRYRSELPNIGRCLAEA